MNRQFKILVLSGLILTTGFWFQNCSSDADLGGYTTQASKEAVVPPVLIGASDDQTVKQGESINLTVDVTGESITYQWYFNDTAMADKTNSLLSISNIQPNQAGIYKVVAENSDGAVEASIGVSVTPTPPAPPPPTPPPPPPPKPVCQIWYQAKNDSALAIAKRDGAFSEYFSGADKDCNDGYCGIRLGAACGAGDEIRLKYQFQFFSSLATEVTSPWSGVSGTIQWGEWSQLLRAGHVTDECQAPLKCGIRVMVETKTGQVCRVTYQYKSGGKFSPATMDGAWAYLPDMGNRDENCSAGSCGMLASMTCP